MKPPHRPRADSGTRRQEIRLPLKGPATAALIAAVFVAYWPTATAGFVFDDEILVRHNPTIEADDALNQIWFTSKNFEFLPLTYTAFFFQHRLWGDQAFGYHLVSLALHAINVVLVWRVLRKLSVPGSWMAALLFAVHPVAASSVAWISEQKTLWSLLFCLVSLLWYLQFQEHRRYRWYVLSLVAFVAALLGKTSIVLAPAVMLLCVWWKTGRIRAKDCLLTVPFFLLSFAAGLTTIWFQFHRGIGTESIPIGDYFERFKAAGYALWFYVGKDLLPLHLSIIYPRWDYSQLTIWPSMGVIAVAAVCWWYRRSWGRAALFAGGCYIAMLLPILGFIKMSFMRHSLVADHFQYAALPVAMAVTTVVGVSMLRPEWAKAAVAGIAAVCLGALTWRQAEVFRDNESLWMETLKQNSDAWAAHSNLGDLYSNRGNRRAALAHLYEAVRLKPDEENTHFLLGTTLFENGDLSPAAAELAEALRLDPQDARAHNNLAIVLNQQHQPAEAAKQAQAAIQIEPNMPEAHFNLGNAYAFQGRGREAAQEYRKALRLKPDFPDAQTNLRIVTGGRAESSTENRANR
jgi:protein O-mannosyl-transferase